MKNCKLILGLILLSACSAAPLTAEESSIKILRKSDTPRDCKELGKVTAPGLASVTEEGREADLKRATFKLGGNTVTEDRRDDNNTIYGTAFNCPTK